MKIILVLSTLAISALAEDVWVFIIVITDPLDLANHFMYRLASCLQVSISVLAGRTGVTSERCLAKMLVYLHTDVSVSSLT
jgi:hypothetical protein